MRRIAGAVLLLVGSMTAAGCGESLDGLNRRAASGSIHEAAPVKAHVQIEIAASPEAVWTLLVDASGWPNWQKNIESVTAAGPLANGSRFSWRTGGTTIHSQVQLFEPEQRLAWTGTAMTAKAVHVWKLKPLPDNHTLVTVNESMDGPWMAKLYPPEKLAAADEEWLRALKGAAEKTR